MRTIILCSQNGLKEAVWGWQEGSAILGHEASSLGQEGKPHHLRAWDSDIPGSPAVGNLIRNHILTP